MLKECFEILEQLESSGRGRKIKEEILFSHKHNQILKDVFRLAYDWTSTYGIRSTEIIGEQSAIASERWDRFNVMLHNFEKRTLSGNQARMQLTEFLKTCSPLENKWYTRIINRDLQINISIDTINKIWPGLIFKFRMQLANSVDFSKITYPMFVQPKFDGIRILFFISSNGAAIATSRGAKTYEHLNFIGEQLFKNWGPGIYDGEILASNWGETLSFVSTHVENLSENKLAYMRKVLIYHVFDKLPYEKEMPLRYDIPYKKRLQSLKRENTNNVKVVSTQIVNDLNHLKVIYDNMLSLGYEGVMLKVIDAPYISDRNNNWLKFKPIKTIDAEILEVIEGDSPSTIGKLGRIKIQLPSGDVAHVGIGFTLKQRELLFKRRKELPGKIIEVRVQDDSDKVAVARFPVFVRLREDRS